MKRSKKIQTHKKRKVQGKRRYTRYRGGRGKPRNQTAENARRKAFVESITVNTLGFVPQEQNAVFTNGNNNYYNNNANANNNSTNANLNSNDPDVSKTLLTLSKLYVDLNNSFDDEAERTKMREALDEYFYALFHTAPKKAPGNTLESLTDSFIYEAQKYMGYTFSKDNEPFTFVMEDLFEAYQHFKSLVSAPLRSNFIKLQQKLNEESINPL